MKKLLIFMLAGALLAGCNQSVSNENTYNKIVTVAITTHDTVMFEDDLGYLWQITESNHQYIEGDICSLTMSYNGTPEYIFDDIILESEKLTYLVED